MVIIEIDILYYLFFKGIILFSFFNLIFKILV
jgi:hypothetical protein